jgi:DNA (cytosine-5)-methyltransferase 1
MTHATSHANAGGQVAVAIPIDVQAAAKNGKKSPNLLGIAADADPFPTLGANDLHASVFRTGGSNSDTNGEIAGTIGSNADRASSNATCVDFDLRDRDGGTMPEGSHDTATIRAASVGSSRSDIASPMVVRRITATEAERLQGFPDSYTLVPYRGKPAADGPRYKALGNSMAVPVIRWLGERIQMVEGLRMEMAA